MHRIERAERPRIADADDLELPAQPPAAAGADTDWDDHVIASDDHGPQLRLRLDRLHNVTTVSLLVGRVDCGRRPIPALPDADLARDIGRRQPVSVGREGEGTNRLTVSLEGFHQRAVLRIDKQDLAQSARGSVAAQREQAVARRGRDRIDAAAESPGDLPADCPLAKIRPADVAAPRRNVPDEDPFVETT